MVHALSQTDSAGKVTRYAFDVLTATLVRLLVIEQPTDPEKYYAMHTKISRDHARELYRKLISEGFAPSA